MTYRLPSASIETAVDHLARYGDTDVFPHMHELAFVRERRAEVISLSFSFDELNLAQFPLKRCR
jgi:hypothetical protein